MRVSKGVLNGCKREGERVQSSSKGEKGRGLCFVMTRGCMAERRDLREGPPNSSSEVEGVKGIPSVWEPGLEDKEDKECVGESHAHPACRR